MPRWTLTPEQRFWSHVKKGDVCWNWTGLIDQAGYGRFSVNGVQAYAHRFSYELLRAPIPEGLQIDHLCRNTICVNPDHLEVVTKRENVLRSFNPPAMNARKTHCIHGHEFTPENTYIRVRGGRTCRTCLRDAKRSSKPRWRVYCTDFASCVWRGYRHAEVAEQAMTEPCPACGAPVSFARPRWGSRPLIRQLASSPSVGPGGPR